MKLIISYEGNDITDSLITPVLPVVAVDAKMARFLFEAELAAAFEADHPSFCAFGHEFLVHNFMRPVTPDRLDYLRQVAQARRKPMPQVYQDSRGATYFRRMPHIETVDEWFDRAHSAAMSDLDDWSRTKAAPAA